MNQTKLEGEKVQFSCEAKALPGNVTVRWFREGAPVTEVSALDTRVSIKPDGSLVINPVSADDSGQYLCEVTNGIGDPQTASAYLNVECESCFEMFHERTVDQSSNLANENSNFRSFAVPSFLSWV